MAFSKIILTGSTDGAGILVTGAAASQANTVHTAVTGTADFDEVYVYVDNFATADLDVTIRWGVTVAQATDIGFRNIRTTVTKGSGPVLMIPGWPLRNALVVDAFGTVAGTATGGLNIYGYAHRVT